MNSMGTGVSPLPIRKDRLEALIHEIADDSSNIRFPEALRSDGTWRGTVSFLQMKRCLEQGVVLAEPVLNKFEHWVATMELYLAAANADVRVEVAVDLNKRTLFVIGCEVI